MCKYDALGSSALSPYLIVRFDIPALQVQQELSFALQLDHHHGQSKLGEVVSLVQDAITDLNTAEHIQGRLQLDITKDKLEAFQKEALQGLEEWHQRLKLADEEHLKADIAKERMNDMRAAYFKELSHLREQLHQKEVAEASIGEFEFVDDMKLFDPMDYTFDDESRQIMEMKLEQIQHNMEEQCRRMSVTYATTKSALTEKLNALTEKLADVQMSMEKKDELLQKLLEERRSKSHLALESTFERQHTGGSRASRKSGGGTPTLNSPCSAGSSIKRKSGRSWTFFNRVGSRFDVVQATDVDKHERTETRKKTFSLTNIMKKATRKTSKPKIQTLLCVVCGKEAAGAHLCSDCFQAESELVSRKPTCEQSVQSDIDGNVVEKAMADYPEVQWQVILGSYDLEAPVIRKFSSIGLQTDSGAQRHVGIQATMSKADEGSKMNSTDVVSNLLGTHEDVGIRGLEEIGDVSCSDDLWDMSATSESFADERRESVSTTSTSITSILQRHGVKVDSEEMMKSGPSKSVPPCAQRASPLPTRQTNRKRPAGSGAPPKTARMSHRGTPPPASFDMSISSKSPMPCDPGDAPLVPGQVSTRIQGTPSQLRRRNSFNGF